MPRNKYISLLVDTSYYAFRKSENSMEKAVIFQHVYALIWYMGIYVRQHTFKNTYLHVSSIMSEKSYEFLLWITKQRIKKWELYFLSSIMAVNAEKLSHGRRLDLWQQIFGSTQEYSACHERIWVMVNFKENRSVKIIFGIRKKKKQFRYLRPKFIKRLEWISNYIA